MIIQQKYTNFTKGKPNAIFIAQSPQKLGVLFMLHCYRLWTHKSEHKVRLDSRLRNSVSAFASSSNILSIIISHIHTLALSHSLFSSCCNLHVHVSQVKCHSHLAWKKDWKMPYKRKCCTMTPVIPTHLSHIAQFS